jgi:hypothetical protein
MERKLQKTLSVPITEGTHYIVELFPGSHLIVTSIGRCVRSGKGLCVGSSVCSAKGILVLFLSDYTYPLV